MDNPTPRSPSSLTRRAFLANSAAVAGAALVAKPSTAFGSTANNRIALGLIGCGGRGQWIADLFARDGNYQFIAGTDYFPDIHQGRISVDNEAQATIVVNKILDYCKTPYTDVNWYDDILLAAYEEYGRYFVWGSETIYAYLNANVRIITGPRHRT